MKHKICVISSLYPPYAKGGAEKAAELTVQGLKEEGHKVFVVTTNPWKNFESLLPQISTPSNSPYFDKTGGESVKVYRFYPLNIFSFLDIDKCSFFARLIWRIFDVFNLHSFVILWYILKREMPDIVWTHNLTGFGLLTPFLLKILRIPHVHTLHDVSLIEPSGIIPYRSLATISWLSYDTIGFLIRLGFGSVTRRLFGSPALIVSPSKWLLDFYLHHRFFGKSKVLVKQNPLTIEVRPPKEVEPPRIKNNLLYIGQLEIHKGILFLISVLDELSAKYDFKLFVVGTGKLFNQLKKFEIKRPWLTLCGRLDNEDLKKIWKESNITIVPSLTYENSPTVIYESLTNGIPIVASRIGGIPELIENEKNGFLFEAGDKDGLKEKLVRMFENPELLQKLSEEAIKFKTVSPEVYVGEVLNKII